MMRVRRLVIRPCWEASSSSSWPKSRCTPGLEDQHERQPAGPPEVLEPPVLVLPDHVLRRYAEAGRARLVGALARRARVVRRRRAARAGRSARRRPPTGSCPSRCSAVPRAGRPPPTTREMRAWTCSAVSAIAHPKVGHVPDLTLPPAPAIARRHGHVHSGKVRDLYELDRRAARRPAADGRQRPDLDLRPRPRARPSRTRARCSPGCRCGGSTSSPTWCPTTCVSTDVPEAVRGRAVVCERLDMYPVECVARGYLTGYRAARLPRHRRGLRDPAARGARGRQPAPGADLHAGDQGRARRARRERLLRRGGRHRRRRAWPTSCATLTLEVYARAEAIARERGHHPGRHQARVRRPRRRDDGARRRGADARLVPVLAGRRVAARAARSRRTTSRSCATGCSRRSPAGTRPRTSRRRRCRPRSSTAPERGTSRPTSCSPA